MTRIRLASVFATVALAVTPATNAQQGPVQRAGQAIENAGRNIRRGVENAVARGQAIAYENDVLGRVQTRLIWDKQLVNSVLQLEMRADGTAVLRGSVLSKEAKKRAVDLAGNTVGVARVIDELAIAKETKVKVIEARPARVITVNPPAATTTVVPPVTTVKPPVVVEEPVETEVIEEPNP
jgi:hypothetical protein